MVKFSWKPKPIARVNWRDIGRKISSSITHASNEIVATAHQSPQLLHKLIREPGMVALTQLVVNGNTVPLQGMLPHDRAVSAGLTALQVLQGGAVGSATLLLKGLAGQKVSGDDVKASALNLAYVAKHHGMTEAQVKATQEYERDPDASNLLAYNSAIRDVVSAGIVAGEAGALATSTVSGNPLLAAATVGAAGAANAANQRATYVT